MELEMEDNDGRISRVKTEEGFAADGDQRVKTGGPETQNDWKTSKKSSRSRKKRRMKKLNIKMIDKEIEAFLGDV